MSRILITGGASGLGLELASQFAARGEAVVVGDLAPERPEGLPEAVAYLRLDVRSEPEWAAAREWVTATWGGLDILVNNAGIATGGRIDRETMAEWERVVAVNLLGVARGCHIFASMFKTARGGHLVNVASLAGLVHGPGMASYNAAKAGVVALSETVRFELEPFDVAVSVVCPSFFRTNLHTSFAGADVAMNASGVSLIEQAPFGAADVAASVIEGIDNRDPVILPDPIAREFAALRANDPAAYEAWARDGAARLARREPS